MEVNRCAVWYDCTLHRSAGFIETVFCISTIGTKFKITNKHRLFEAEANLAQKGLDQTIVSPSYDLEIWIERDRVVVGRVKSISLCTGSVKVCK